MKANKKHPGQDSNLDFKGQNLTCCHYTTWVYRNIFTFLVAVEGIEPSLFAYETNALPLSYTAIELLYKDSNLDQQGQNLLCCHYTIEK